MCSGPERLISFPSYCVTFDANRIMQKGLVQNLMLYQCKHSHTAVRFLLKAFVVCHAQGHLAHLTAETAFVPILEVKNKVKWNRAEAVLLVCLPHLHDSRVPYCQCECMFKPEH